MLTLMAALAVFAIWQVEQIRATIDTLTHSAQIEKALADEIRYRILAARLNASLFERDQTQTAHDAFDAEISILRERLVFGSSNINSAGWRAQIDAIQRNTDAYAQGFAEVAQIICTRRRLQSTVLDVQSLAIENNLSALRIHINTLNAPTLFLAYGNAQNAYQAMRLNTLNYLTTGNERYAVLLQKNIQEIQEALTTLRNNLSDAAQQTNVDEATHAANQYAAGFNQIQTDYQRQRSIFREQLDPLEAQITQQANQLTDEVNRKFDAQNRASLTRAGQTWQIILAATLGALALGLGLGITLSRQITRPLQQVSAASQQIAHHDLKTLIEQMQQLSQGDVHLKFQAQTRLLPLSSEDELGQMAAAFNQVVEQLHLSEIAFKRMADYLNEMAGAAQQVARGNLEVSLHDNGAQDVLGNAILQMLGALRNAEQRTREQLAQIEILREIDGLITANEPLAQTLEHSLRAAAQHLGMTAGVVSVINPEDNVLTPLVARTFDGANLAEPPSILCRHHTQTALSQQTAVLFANLADAPAEGCNATMLESGSRAYAAFPLVTQQQVQGVFELMSDMPLTMDASWIGFAHTLAGQIAIAISHSALLRSLEERVAQRTRELDESRQFFEAVVQHSPVAIVVTDVENQIVSWNPEAQNLFGYAPEEVIGRNIDEVVAHGEPYSEAKQISEQVQQHGVVRRFTRRTRKDGSQVDVEVAGLPIVVNERHIAGMAIYHDISDLQRARRAAEEATQTKSAFLATMSHEIRTPMNGVIGMTSLLMNTTLNEEQREFVETIRQSGEALLTIINDILDFSKIEAGRMEIEYQPFNLRECIESALDLLAPSAAEKGLELGYLIERNTPEAIYGDITRLRQVLVNLLSNAVKFTEKGEVMVNVGIQATQEQRFTVHFSVRDTGIGIPQERSHLLFQSFSQIDASTTRKYGGTGLGLAICKRLTEMMGGEIWVESSGIPGKGSTFHFTIQTEASSDLPSMTPAIHSPSLKARHVLIVDDNLNNCQILTHMTQSWGMKPTAVTSGAAALALIAQQSRFDIAILDVQMPEMDGLTLAGALHTRPETAEIPIIILTSLGRRDEAPPEVRISAYLYKPIKTSQLYDALVTAFAKSPVYVAADAPPVHIFDPQLGARHPLRILLAEDHAVNQKVALMLLQRLGYRADIAANGIEAVQAVLRQQYDLILMDVHMLEMNGIEATRRIREILPAERQPYITALTANALEGDRETYLAAGMDDYLSKPLHTEQLLTVLSHCPAHTAIEPIAAPAVSTAPSDSHAVNLHTLQEYFPNWQNDPTMLIELSEMFFDDTETRLKQITDWITTHEGELARRSAHAIKGASLTFGAEHLSQLCKQLEDCLRATDWQQAQTLFESLRAEYHRVQHALRLLASHYSTLSST
ncbi:MAG: hypothetical protein OHK0052_15050 [Anaerolineales bacterium]